MRCWLLTGGGTQFDLRNGLSRFNIDIGRADLWLTGAFGGARLAVLRSCWCLNKVSVKIYSSNGDRRLLGAHLGALLQVGLTKGSQDVL